MGIISRMHFGKKPILLLTIRPIPKKIINNYNRKCGSLFHKLQYTFESNLLNSMKPGNRNLI